MMWGAASSGSVSGAASGSGNSNISCSPRNRIHGYIVNERRYSPNLCTTHRSSYHYRRSRSRIDGNMYPSGDSAGDDRTRSTRAPAREAARAAPPAGTRPMPAARRRPTPKPCALQRPSSLRDGAARRQPRATPRKLPATNGAARHAGCYAQAPRSAAALSILKLKLVCYS